MNPTNRASRYGGEGGAEQGEQGKQSSGGAKKARAFMGDSPHPPHCPNEPDATLPTRPNDTNNDDDVFTDTSRTLQDEAESKGEEGMAVAAPVIKMTCKQHLPSWLLWDSPLQLPSPQLPKGPSPGHHPSHQGVVAADSQEKRN